VLFICHKIDVAELTAICSEVTFLYCYFI